MPIIWRTGSRELTANYDDPKRRRSLIKMMRVHMAHIDIHYGFSVNGVAAIHTEILKEHRTESFL